MKSTTLIRSASFRTPSRLVFGSDNSGSGIFSLRRSRSISMSPRQALNYADVKLRKDDTTIRRARSETDLMETDRPSRIRSPPAGVPKNGEESSHFRGSAAATVPEEEAEVSGGGRGRGVKIGGSSEGGGQNEKRRMERYYREMLRSDPSNPLLLRNYGKFLHEVEGDVRGAEECYSRAILESPKDGDVLSLYGKLVWETHKDEARADSYFQRAVEASPDDCYVLGSYASFLWDAEDEEDQEEEARTSQQLVEAF